ncbi:MAG: carbon-nitrogen hydrolase family protein [Pseudomonadales bacterium]|nr:carbon-nitrogen hydrolase family protein [Pseudomonadales bacterium]
MHIAAIQMCSTQNAIDNIEQASALIQQAADAGAQFVVTPEMTSFLVSSKADLLLRAKPEHKDKALKAFQTLAEALSIYLQIGSMAILGPEGKCFNRSFVIAPDGRIIARYDKIHLFDVDLANGETVRESHSYSAGDKAVISKVAEAHLGLSICYDLRFANLYHSLAQAGAQIITIPAAFTAVTGQAHWHVLTRARAIETGCFIIAPAQVGLHEDGRSTYGHSLIINPWGEVIAESDTEAPGFIHVAIDLADVNIARKRIANLSHQKPFQLTRF